MLSLFLLVLVLVPGAVAGLVPGLFFLVEELEQPVQLLLVDLPEPGLGVVPQLAALVLLVVVVLAIRAAETAFLPSGLGGGL